MHGTVGNEALTVTLTDHVAGVGVNVLAQVVCRFAREHAVVVELRARLAVVELHEAPVGLRQQVFHDRQAAEASHRIFDGDGRAGSAGVAVLDGCGVIVMEWAADVVDAMDSPAAKSQHTPTSSIMSQKESCHQPPRAETVCGTNQSCLQAALAH